MKTSTSERKHGIQWIARNQLDLYYVNELTLLTQTNEGEDSQYSTSLCISRPQHT
ncbi:unnamed protein product [Schistosoma margrebowiei]|uniref:Uncharacterized protein n=1 Tax=Schistosoma margrebowiei TaxID=48269 RepID=A0A183M3K0_9TREM|nr:unnamed protein product [Schistosoma margrebowiei]